MWSEKPPLKRAETVILVIFSAWCALVFIAPFTLAPGTVADLSGRVGYIDHPQLYGQLNPLAAVVYWLGDANCHQMASRSFFLNGNEMPFCSRDVGIFIGLVVGMLVALVRAPKLKLWLIIIGFVPILIDGGAQLVTSYSSSNPLRLATGLIAGFASAMLIHYFAVKAHSSSSRRKPSVSP
ncbi:MAG TPA: DUF2085 domain-containing protein [Methanomassiliicoccales archaeon]|nr:DUF2085 domain-containing protein [Methanomassiliicoccales archaeon]